MKAILLVASSTLLLSFTSFQVQKAIICNSPSAKVYHLTKTCRGLKACKHELKEISIADAKNLGRKLCGFED